MTDARTQVAEDTIQYQCQRVAYELPLGIKVERDEIEQILIPKKFLEKALAQAAVDDLPYISFRPSPNRQIYLDIQSEVQQSQEIIPTSSEKGPGQDHGA